MANKASSWRPITGTKIVTINQHGVNKLRRVRRISTYRMTGVLPSDSRSVDVEYQEALQGWAVVDGLSVISVHSQEEMAEIAALRYLDVVNIDC